MAEEEINTAPIVTLREWLDMPAPDGLRRSVPEFANAVGVAPDTLDKYMARRAWPRKNVMLAIYRETSGAVTPNSFLGDESLRLINARRLRYIADAPRAVAPA